MPYESPEQIADRKKRKAARAHELAARQRRLDNAIYSRLLIALSAQYVRGFDELGALLRVSTRQAQEIAARPNFPRKKNIGDRIALFKTEDVIAWIDRQELAQ
jgi:hypothetical protein